MGKFKVEIPISSLLGRRSKIIVEKKEIQSKMCIPIRSMVLTHKTYVLIYVITLFERVITVLTRFRVQPREVKSEKIQMNMIPIPSNFTRIERCIPGNGNHGPLFHCGRDLSVLRGQNDLSTRDDH